ncbi:quinol:cytochrome C oxidoreductase [Flavobacterium sp. Sd200]|uniref:quinol:cytochrome C oxidoreductase n=1 Tax=Flavobacterium sp. Sd200 TaxID=2692211 RepID=UPI00136D063D|nr:quinol:cytochrome C oxidoreductase [Flavobacterium sp. Sd200]MXN92269.1 quinol:cytochrome C oxidoreductase [Flavobacterium sp. Sd200]
MYTFSSKLKTLAFILMVVGIIGVGYSFFTAPKTLEEAEAIIAAQHHGGHGEAAHHEGTHSETHENKADEAHVTHVEDTVKEGHKLTDEEKAHLASDSVSSIVATAPAAHDSAVAEESHEAHAEAAVAGHDAHKAHDAHATHDEHKEHAEHVFHQLQNKPWAAVYVAALFFMLISLGVLAFYAIQNAAQAGWSPVLFRVMEGITSYLIPGAIIVFIFLVVGVLHFHHLFIWLDPEVVAEDHLIQQKSGYLNGTFFLIRAAVFIGGWIFYRQYSRKQSLAQDEATDNLSYKKSFKGAAAFLVFFIVSESIMSWDWIMSVDPHWYSTLFGWYVFASFFVSGITTIALITLYLKSKGYLEYVNTSHIHDLAKFMFGISVFWTYLWFSQFMLMWYADMPEEVVYFKMRIENYNLPFFGMVAMNFLFPVLILINTDFKRLSWIIVMAGIVILLGHYIDFFNMIMPATVGDQWFIGAGEIGAVLFFLGLFILVVFTALTKVPLLAKRNPLIEESKHFHY